MDIKNIPFGIINGKFILFYENVGYHFPGGYKFFSYFEEKGFKIAENIKPQEEFFDLVQILTEEELILLNVPQHVAIVLPTNPFLLDSLKDESFLMINRDKGLKGEIKLFPIWGAWNSRDFSFLFLIPSETRCAKCSKVKKILYPCQILDKKWHGDIKGSSFIHFCSSCMVDFEGFYPFKSKPTLEECARRVERFFIGC